MPGIDEIRIVTASRSHLSAWAAMRAELWPPEAAAEHAGEIVAALDGGGDQTAFVALAGAVPIGFAEASIRHDSVNGCDTSPVAFLEGLFVATEHRRRGVAQALCDHVEAWGRSRGCTELGSDAEEENGDGLGFHRGNGFEETERVVFFRKLL